MRAFKLSRRPQDWVVISIWHCKFEPGMMLCACCEPKHVVPPGVLKHPDKEFRDYFRQTDSTGKSRTPRGSTHKNKSYEPRNFKL